MFWAALSMTAALVMTACSSDDNMMTPAALQGEVKTIPYSVTVNEGAATNRATVDSDNKTLRFATGDKLYITGTNIQGTLVIQTGSGTASATFSGDLTYTGEGSPASDLSLTATLVSAQQTVGTEVSVDAAGAVTVNYPTTAYCDDVATAVQKYSNLTGTSTYGTKSFTLSQKTAFLNFEITFEDGTTAGTPLTTVVSNNGSALCTANVTTVDDGGVKAKFVLPVMSSATTLSSANVKMGDNEAISFGASQMLTGKVYNVKKTQAAAAKTLAEATAGDIGKVVGADGKIYANVAAAKAAGTTACAIIAYVGSATGESQNHGLAIAMKDAAAGGEVKWSSSSNDESLTNFTNTNLAVTTAQSGRSNSQTSGFDNESNYPAFYAALHNTITVSDGISAAAPASGTSGWFLPSLYQWNMIVKGLSGQLADMTSGTNYYYATSSLNTKIEAAGGTGLQSSGRYWSSTEYGGGNAWFFHASYGSVGDRNKDQGYYVRSAFAF